MNRLTPQIRNYAARIIAYEKAGSRSPVNKFPAAFRICEKLRPQLTTLMGDGGYRTLLARALMLSKPEAPWLHGVRVNADGFLEGFTEAADQVDPEQLAEGGVVLLSQLFGLLSAFIGQNLTLGLVTEAWPGVPLKAAKMSNGDKHENSN
jgi:hypothetical protein